MDEKIKIEMTTELPDEMQISTQSASGSDDDTQSDGFDFEPSITSVTELSDPEESNFVENENVTETQNNMFSDLPDFSQRSDWYKHNCFRRYWDHYRFVMSWCKKHYETCNRLRTRQTSKRNAQRNPMTSENLYANYPCFQSPHPYYSYLGGFQWQPGQGQSNLRQTSQSSRSRQRQMKQKEGTEEEAEHEELHSEVSGTEAFEMEITEDMIEFFTKSQAHRKQRDEQKKEEKEKEKKKPELVDLENLQASPQRERTVEAPKERPGSRRTSEMKQLYGKGAAMIHGMETAIQMTFDRNKDLKQPKLWPNMPLKIVFN